MTESMMYLVIFAAGWFIGWASTLLACGFSSSPKAKQAKHRARIQTERCLPNTPDQERKSPASDGSKFNNQNEQ